MILIPPKTAYKVIFRASFQVNLLKTKKISWPDPIPTHTHISINPERRLDSLLLCPPGLIAKKRGTGHIIRLLFEQKLGNEYSVPLFSCQVCIQKVII